MASAKLNRMFCESQPIVLKASVTPTDTPFEAVSLVMSAEIAEALLALTVTVPAVVVTELLVIFASAPLSTRFVASRTLTATELPPSNGLPPSEITLLVSVASIVAASRAVTATPVPAVTTWFAISLETPPRTSLTTMSAPMA